jgi:hypothetical protein
METKLSTVDHMALLKTLARNYWLFWRKAKNNKRFFLDLEKLANEGNLASVREELPFINTDISIIEAFAYYPKSHEAILGIGRKIRSQMSIGHIVKMEELLETWMDKLDFGPEWKDTLVTFITTGILCPPIYTFHVEMIPAKNDRKSDKKLVKMVLTAVSKSILHFYKNYFSRHQNHFPHPISVLLPMLIQRLVSSHQQFPYFQ